MTRFVQADEPRLDWQRLPSIPDTEGFAGSFAGISNGHLIVAGGANFPGKKPWEGGEKRWYDEGCLLNLKGEAEWLNRSPLLPGEVGYGVSITAGDSLIGIGGSNSHQHFKAVWALTYRSEGQRTRLKSTRLPNLPLPCANACGALVTRRIYVAGGIETPPATKAMHTFWSLDLDDLDPGWRAWQPWPGPERMLAVAGAFDGKFYLFGGAALDAGPDGKPVRRWLTDAYCYSPTEGWRRLADLPRPCVAAPSPAVATGDGKLLILGGDDGRQLTVPHDQHQGFPRDVLIYDVKTDRWSRGGEVPFSLVTTPAVIDGDTIIVPGGEKQPGIRSTEVWRGRIVTNDKNPGKN